MRQLVVMRHAKAELHGPTDQERELAPRGCDDAAAAGRWLAGRGVVADGGLVSSAHRTVTTWERVAEAAGWEVSPLVSTALYAAGPESALDLVRETPEDVQCLVVVGHNPTMAYLAQLLDEGGGDADAQTAMAQGFPTSALALFEYDGAWAELDLASARLAAFHVARA